MIPDPNRDWSRPSHCRFTFLTPDLFSGNLVKGDKNGSTSVLVLNENDEIPVNDRAGSWTVGGFKDAETFFPLKVAVQVTTHEATVTEKSNDELPICDRCGGSEGVFPVKFFL